ncbi:amidohydrolase [Emticicia aquatilis]|uniref:Amidohydrolase n=1 Tax=Emticicia aquatilis TaxID=1537369 RepID=A0A916YUK0_9BACT|nr:amidohydrolase family protein [Emticicia aquatilis]GGD61058.1 amidohydrolase [Emticicia aquatilis]
MTIDSHQHFWTFDPIRDSWITDDMSVIQRNFYPEDLQSTLQQNGIDACVAVQADQSLAETRFLLDLAAKNNFVKAVVGWIDLQADDIDEQLSEWKSEKKLAGFRHVLQAEPNVDYMLRPNFLRGISKLKKYGFTYDVLIFPKHLATAQKFVAQFPDQPFVLDHIAKPYIKAGLIDEWERDIKALSKFENLQCKVSGIITEADWENWTYEQIKPYLEVVFDAFGTGRIMFGSDWPVCLVAGEYSQVKEIIDTYTKDFSASEKAKVFGENAAKFYEISE